MSEKSNIPKEIAGAKSSDLKFSPTDPATAELVKEFIAQKAGETGEAPPAVESPEAGDPQNPEQPPTKINLPPNQEFEGGDPNQQFITEALSPMDRIEISDAEKELFLKAVLCDEPVRLVVKLYNGKMPIELRSRSSFEQKRVFDILKEDLKDGLYQDGDLAMMVTRMHYYLGALMIERINGELFSELKLTPGNKIDEDKKTMRDAVDKLFEGMGTIRWTSILNALRIFEHKCARMNSEAANEGFWKPQS